VGGEDEGKEEERKNGSKEDGEESSLVKRA